MADNLIVYQCSCKHRICRKAEAPTTCMDCGSPMRKIASVERKEGESDLIWRCRALETKEGK